MRKEKFIKFRNNNPVYLMVKWTKYIHQRLKSFDLNEDTITPPTPYHVFLVWLLEIVQYGFIAFIAYVCLKRWWLYPIAFGCIRWLWIDIVKETSNAIRGKE